MNRQRFFVTSCVESISVVDTLDVRPATWTFPLTAHAQRKSSISVSIIDVNIHKFMNVHEAAVLPPGGQNCGCLDRPRYNRMRVTLRADCICCLPLLTAPDDSRVAGGTSVPCRGCRDLSTTTTLSCLPLSTAPDDSRVAGGASVPCGRRRKLSATTGHLSTALSPQGGAVYMHAVSTLQLPLSLVGRPPLHYDAHHGRRHRSVSGGVRRGSQLTGGWSVCVAFFLSFVCFS